MNVQLAMKTVQAFPFSTTKRIGNFVHITYDCQKSFPKKKRKFRIAIYGAYDAFGLIGPEENGIVIFDEDKKAVLCDQIDKADSGYFGPTKRQLEGFRDLLKMDWKEFKKFVNHNPRTRYEI